MAQTSKLPMLMEDPGAHLPHRQFSKMRRFQVKTQLLSILTQFYKLAIANKTKVS